MRCHYEVLGVARDADDAQLKKAYRKLALKLHPDKNIGDAGAADRFKELNASYETLSDGTERRWYDDHRDDILAGRDLNDSSSSDDEDYATRKGPRLKKREVNLWPFFSSSAFEGFDGEKSFYAVYGKAFSDVEDSEEQRASFELADRAPFGTATTPWDDVKAFYDKFADFVSQRTFSAYDKYKAASDEGRRMRRAVDTENGKHRKAAKGAYQDMVRQLAVFCRRRDPRVKERMKVVAQEKEEKVQKASALKAQRRQENLEARLKWREEGPVDDGYEARQGVTLHEMDDKTVSTEAEIFSCHACKKTFKSEKQYANHCLSKAHKKKAGNAPVPPKPRVDSFDAGFFSDPTANDGEIAAALAEESSDDDGAAVPPEAAPVDDTDDATSSDSSDGDFVNPFAAAAADTSDDDGSSATSADSETETPAPALAPVPQEKPRKARRAKKDKTAAAAPPPPPPPPAAASRRKKGKKGKRGDVSDDDVPAMACTGCAATFPSRSKLFAHLKANPGHAKLKK